MSLPRLAGVPCAMEVHVTAAAPWRQFLSPLRHRSRLWWSDFIRTLAASTERLRSDLCSSSQPDVQQCGWSYRPPVSPGGAVSWDHDVRGSYDHSIMLVSGGNSALLELHMLVDNDPCFVLLCFVLFFVLFSPTSCRFSDFCFLCLQLYRLAFDVHM